MNYAHIAINSCVLDYLIVLIRSVGKHSVLRGIQKLNRINMYDENSIPMEKL